MMTGSQIGTRGFASVLSMEDENEQNSGMWKEFYSTRSCIMPFYKCMNLIEHTCSHETCLQQKWVLVIDPEVNLVFS